jgi:hypothetical protein
MIWIGALVLIAIAAYVIFMALDAVGLSSQRGEATVVGREHLPAGTTYATQVIGGQTRTLPQTKPDTYVLELEIGGERVRYPVEKELWDSLEPGARVNARWIRRRITRALQVQDVAR